MRLYDCLCLWVELPLVYYTKWVFLASAGNIFYRNAHAISNRLQERVVHHFEEFHEKIIKRSDTYRDIEYNSDFKKQILENFGWTVIDISHFDWMALDEDSKISFIRKILLENKISVKY